MPMIRVAAPCWTRALPIGLAALVLAAAEGRADKIVLRGGGQVRGKVVADAKRPERVTVFTETGKTPLNFDKNRITEVVPEPSALDDYVVKRGKVAKSAEAQYTLGLWCAEHKLADLAEVHYEAALKEDNTFALAHQKLGHVLYSDRWLNRDELRAAQGLVLYKGKWITKEEKEHREDLAALTAEQASWGRRIKLLRQAVAKGPVDRRREAESQLLEIRDPIAVKPLVGVLGDDINPLRTMLDRILVEIPRPRGRQPARHPYPLRGRLRRAFGHDGADRAAPEVSEVLPLLLKAAPARASPSS